jgi:hypothetical protein
MSYHAVGYQLHDMQRIAAFNYVDQFSVGSSGLIDLQIGMANKMCGSNQSRELHPGDLCIISTLIYRGVRSFLIGRISSEDFGEGVTVWLEKGGCMWKHNYSYRPITRLLSTSDPEVRDLFGAMSPREISDIFSDHRCSGGPFKEHYSKIVKGLTRDKRFRPKKSARPPSAPAPPPTALTAPEQPQ